MVCVYNVHVQCTLRYLYDCKSKQFNSIRVNKNYLFDNGILIVVAFLFIVIIVIVHNVCRTELSTAVAIFKTLALAALALQDFSYTIDLQSMMVLIH